MNIGGFIFSLRTVVIASTMLFIAIASWLLLIAFRYGWISHQVFNTLTWALFALPVLLGVLGLGSGLLRYLDTGSSYASRDRYSIRTSVEFDSLKAELANVGKQIVRLEGRLNEAGTVRFNIESIDKGQLLESLKHGLAQQIQGLIEGINERAFNTIDAEFAKRAERVSDFKNLVSGFDEIRKRLTFETNNLARRANLNLIFGTITTLLAGVGLIYIVLIHPLDLTGANKEEYTWRIAAHYVPRISFIVFAELFAYFFLRLYKSGLSDIKYYQNEITNVDLKLMALKAALASDDPKDLGMVIRELSKTERNFVLKRGETTIELERSKADESLGRDLVKQVASYVRADRKAS